MPQRRDARLVRGRARPHLAALCADEDHARRRLPVARTQGCRIVLADGRELIDGIASWWTACHGYNHPHIRAAVERQLAGMPHVMFGGLAHEQALTLARRLAALLPGDLDRVFFSESGSVAVEVAMKMAVQYWLNRGVRGAHANSSPSRAAITATPPARWRSAIRDDGMHALFHGLLPRAFRRRPAARRGERGGARRGCSSAHARRDRRHHRRAAGAGRGRHALPRRRGAAPPARAADRYDLLLIFDEIFTGFGRTGTHVRLRGGRRRARHRHAVEGADRRHAAARRHHRARARCSTRSGRTIPTHALMHGPTFMGNALACAAANASLDLFEREPRLAQVAAIAAAAGARARALPRPARRQGRAGARARSAWSSSTASTISTRCARASSRRACSSGRSATSSI